MTTKEHLTKHDKEIAAIRLLLRQGMRLLVDVQTAQKRTEQGMRLLQQSQQRTEKNLAHLIAALERGTNGKH